ncbi:MAG TPA: hypothetical protein PKW95_02875 [bacterium]|nr:hypothetical protein [bacterium]
MYRLSNHFTLAMLLIFLCLAAPGMAWALQAFALKVNPQGEQVWYQGLQEKMIGSPDDGGLGPEIELDEENNVYLTAFLFVAGLSNDGQVIWKVAIRAPLNLLAFREGVAFEEYIDFSHIIYRYNINGLLWSTFLDDYIVEDMQPGLSNYLYTFGITSSTEEEYTIIVIDSEGDILHKYHYLIDNSYSRYSCLFSLHDSGFYVASYCSRAGHEDEDDLFCLDSHSLDGERIGFAVVDMAEAKTLTTDADGNALLACMDIYDISPEGEVLWSFEVGGVVYDMQVDTDGSIYALSQPGDSRAILTRLDADGGFLWQEQYRGEHIRARTLRLDDDGNAYIVGTSCNDTGEWYTDCRALAIKYSSEGEPLWARTYQGVDGYDCYAYDAAVDADGNLYLSGYSHDSKDDGGGGNSLGCGCLP